MQNQRKLEKERRRKKMRFNTIPPTRGQKRTIKHFTLFPLKFDGMLYWMENILLHQEYQVKHTKDRYGRPHIDKKWVTVKIY